MNRWPVLAEFRSLGVLAVPIIITQLAQMGMGVADAIMAGRVSATELAGISLGGNLYWPLMLPAMLAYVALRCLAIDRSSAGRGLRALRHWRRPADRRWGASLTGFSG